MRQLSDHLFIKLINKAFNILFIISVVFLSCWFIYNFFPKSSNKIQERNVIILKKNTANFDANTMLGKWFNDRVIVQSNNRGVVYINLAKQNYTFMDTFFLQTLEYVPFIYFILVFYLFKRILNDMKIGNVFSSRNVYRLTIMGFLFLSMPTMYYIKQFFFLDFIRNHHISNLQYSFENGNNLLIGSETIIGVAVLIFAIVFKTGSAIKKENESFI